MTTARKTRGKPAETPDIAEIPREVKFLAIAVVQEFRGNGNRNPY
jgi:hypothetical protein